MTEEYLTGKLKVYNTFTDDRAAGQWPAKITWTGPELGFAGLSPPVLSFFGPAQNYVGRLEIKGGALTFEGDADTLAKQFFSFLIRTFGAWCGLPTKRAYRRYTDVSNCVGVELEWTDEGVTVTPFALGVYSGHWNIRTITINQGKTDDLHD